MVYLVGWLTSLIVCLFVCWLINVVFSFWGEHAKKKTTHSNQGSALFAWLLGWFILVAWLIYVAMSSWTKAWLMLTRPNNHLSKRCPRTSPMPAQQQLQQTKVTDGRAQMRLKDELGCTAVAKYVREVLPPSFFGAGLLMHDAYLDTVLSATLGRNVQPAVYGFSAGTISEPAHELNEFGSLRMNMSGARVVAMVSAKDVAEHTKHQDCGCTGVAEQRDA